MSDNSSSRTQVESHTYSRRSIIVAKVADDMFRKYLSVCIIAVLWAKSLAACACSICANFSPSLSPPFPEEAQASLLASLSLSLSLPHRFSNRYLSPSHAKKIGGGGASHTATEIPKGTTSDQYYPELWDGDEDGDGGCPPIEHV